MLGKIGQPTRIDAISLATAEQAAVELKATNRAPPPTTV